MKHRKDIAVFVILSCFLTGCSQSKDSKIDNIINLKQSKEVSNDNQQENDPENLSEITPNIQSNDSINQSTSEETNQAMNEDFSSEGVDYDLTKMDSNMVYATVFEMMRSPERYEGKVFKIHGTFSADYYEPTKQYYYYIQIADAMACCSTGLEFVWGDGTHKYPQEYPKENTEILVTGTFETYQEEGDENLYCHIKDATLEWD